jgi:hypothetical protein
MTSHWGPLGWMTLHSASMLYPENPEPVERLLMEYFINLFGETISCFTCKTHFITMKKKICFMESRIFKFKKRIYVICISST